MSEENVFHMEHDEPEHSRRTEEVMRSVRNELAKNRATIVDEVREQAIPEIEAAVKRALEGTSTSGEKGKKRSCKQHVFKNKGNQRRYEKNEEVMEILKRQSTRSEKII